MARTHTHGRCWHCNVIFRWEGRPKLREAACPRCRRGPLARTAARLAKHVPVVDECPLLAFADPR